MTVPVETLTAAVTLMPGDCLDVLKTLDDNSVDSCVTDPPYHLTSIVKRFGSTSQADDTQTSDRARRGADGMARLSRGFMGKQWDGGDIAFRPDLWREVYRVLKPGGFIVAFGGTRTYHRMACAIEDAGFEVRDMISWLYGSGFPKSHDVSKAIDRELGCERTKVRIDAAAVRNPKATGAGRDGTEGATRPWIESAMARGFHEAVSDEAVSDEAVSWRGFGTALKPACEPAILARKPLVGTVAENVLKHGTGALNIEGSRVAWAGIEDAAAAAAAAAGFADSRARGTSAQSNSIGKESRDGSNNYDPHALVGRWPANVIHDGSAEVVGAFPDAPGALRAVNETFKPKVGTAVYGDYGPRPTVEPRGDTGSAARFFYTAKADADDRLGSKHPTVKPVDLIQYLVRLVTPPRGLVLDPFAGTGTCGEACIREGFRALLIEREAEYCDDIRRRMKLAMAGPDERAREAIKAKLKDKPVDAGPLFASDDYDANKDFSASLDLGYSAIKERVAKGGEGWNPTKTQPE